MKHYYNKNQNTFWFQLEEEKQVEVKKAASSESSRVESLEKEVREKEDQRDAIQAEVDRLLGILKDTENEKHEKDKQIKELQEWVCLGCIVSSSNYDQ